MVGYPVLSLILATLTLTLTLTLIHPNPAKGGRLTRLVVDVAASACMRVQHSCVNVCVRLPCVCARVSFVLSIFSALNQRSVHADGRVVESSSLRGAVRARCRVERLEGEACREQSDEA